MKQTAIVGLLNELEAELKRLALWQEGPVDPALLESQAPFCCDTLRFEQWLQFVLLPRMRALLEANQPLPTAIALCPMAEESLDHRLDIGRLINVLADIDETLSGERHQTLYRDHD